MTASPVGGITTSVRYQCGPFVVEPAAYRLLKDGSPVAIPPQLFELLLYLVDHAGSLVTKDSLLATLWADANITENVLTRAISDLRHVLNDNARAPQYIKTVARRGYRFIAPVSQLPGRQFEPRHTSQPGVDVDVPPALAVLEFTNLTGDASWTWLEVGIPETVTGDLRTLGLFRVVDRARVLDARRATSGTVQDLAAHLGVRLVVQGSFQLTQTQIRITARVVDVETGETVAEAKVDGPSSSVFALQDQIADQLGRALGATPRRAPWRLGMTETANLEAYRAWTEGWLTIESFDVRTLPDAVEDFRRAVGLDPRYAAAYAGLATAELALYESTRLDPEPHAHLLTQAEAHARHALTLDPGLAEAHGALAMTLVSTWRTAEAVAAARRAVALEPGQWRHLFRLCHATWGEQRLDAAAQTLALYPQFAFAHFQMAMVYVARGQLTAAETVLLDGVEVEDRQHTAGGRFPALGLHWLLGLVYLHHGDVPRALREFDQEQDLAHPDRLYGREFAMDAWLGRGFARLRAGRPDEAVDAFAHASALYPAWSACHMAHAEGLRALGRRHDAEHLLAQAEAHVNALVRRRPVEGALARAQLLAARGDTDRALQQAEQLLSAAPPGYVAWRLGIDPLFWLLCDGHDVTPLLRRLADRAR